MDSIDGTTPVNVLPAGKKFLPVGNVSLRRFALGVGISETMVRRYRNNGVFAPKSQGVKDKSKHPFLIMPDALHDWVNYGLRVDGDFAGGEIHVAPEPIPEPVPKIKTEKPQKTKPPKPTPPAVIPADISEIPSKAVSDAKKSHYEAEMSRIKVEEKMGTLVARSDVERQLFSLGQALRQRLELMPKKIAAFMTGDKRADEERMSREVESFLVKFTAEAAKMFEKEDDEDESDQ